MSQFKVGDICRFKGSVFSVNEGKIFTLVKYIGKTDQLFPHDLNYWETDCEFSTNLNSTGDGPKVNICPESCMRKLDNPGDDVVDEMIKLLGPAPKVKEPTHAL